MDLIGKDQLQELLKKIDSFVDLNKPKSVGQVISIGDGVAYLSGLNNVMMSERVSVARLGAMERLVSRKQVRTP